MNRMLSAALAVAILAGVSASAHADGTRISIAPFQSRQAWQANWDDLNQRGNDAGAQWDCHGDHECNLYFIVKPGVKAHLATERYGRGYCYIVEGAATADCYREDGKKTVWTLDKPFDYGLAPQSAPAPTYVAPAPTYTPPPVEYHPSTTTSVSNDVPFTMVNGGIMVKVNFPGYWATMQVDTGAGMSSIAKGLADKLIAEGHATEKGEQRFIMANGSIDVEKVIVIDSIAVGSHTVNHVEMSVVPDNGANMLLGLPVLNSIGKFTIDSAVSQLIFG